MRPQKASISMNLLDMVYPPRCMGCGAVRSELLCESCRLFLPRILPPLCDYCGSSLTETFCRSCNEHGYAFRHARAVGVYDGCLRHAILKLKFTRWKRAADLFGELLEELWRSPQTQALHSAQLLLPVPIHWARKAERGFNQSELIARALAKRIGLPVVCDAVQRRFYRKPQVGLSGTHRWQNIEGAFELIQTETIQGKHCLLIDDVFTTGATLDTCARSLLSGGAAKVSVLVMARESSHSPPPINA
ncbi:MAG: ComF family protein [Fimbriimonadia bacterium]|nr:ComF family protein [Fimbriimonadia bacterium]